MSSSAKKLEFKAGSRKQKVYELWCKQPDAAAGPKTEIEGEHASHLDVGVEPNEGEALKARPEEKAGRGGKVKCSEGRSSPSATNVK
jgi:hypothetical protein